MKAWILYRPSGEIAQIFIQEDEPTEEYLSAFRRHGSPGWSLIERTLSDDEELSVVRDRRAQEYPPVSDLADAIYWREKGDPSPLAAWINACDAIKSRHPKPPRR